MTIRNRNLLGTLPASSVVDMLTVAWGAGGGSYAPDTDVVDCINVSNVGGSGEPYAVASSGPLTLDKQSTFLSFDFYITDNDHDFYVGLSSPYGVGTTWCFLSSANPGSGREFRLSVGTVGTVTFTDVVPAATTWYHCEIKLDGTEYTATLEVMSDGQKEAVSSGVPAGADLLSLFIFVGISASTRFVKVRFNSLQTSMDHTL